jgi:nucleotidyltransferase substrate binding protein (TIGR01987 family)
MKTRRAFQVKKSLTCGLYDGLNEILSFMSKQDIRWIQRFSNFRKAMEKLKDAINEYEEEEMSDLEKEGLVQRFEYTFELAWKTLQDFLYQRGYVDIKGPTLVLKQAFQDGYITDERTWRKMKEARELTSHTYDEDRANEIVEKIVLEFWAPLLQLMKRLDDEMKKNFEK